MNVHNDGGGEENEHRDGILLHDKIVSDSHEHGQRSLE